MTAFELMGKLSLDSSEFSSSLNQQESNFKKFGNRMSTWAVAKGRLLGGFIEKAGRATIGFVKNSIQESASFDKSMAQVAATLGKSTSEIKDLSNFARKMGAETAFTAQEAAEGLNYMALAGYDAQTSMKMLPTVLNLAAAGNMKLADASDMVTDAQSALGLSIAQTEVMVDQMAKTSSKTNTSVSQLGQAFLTVGGTAKKLKGGTQELSALLGVLANNGIKGAEGGTALRNVLNGLANPAGKAAKQLKSLGVEAYDADDNLRSMPDILTDMNNALGDKTMKERTEIFAEAFNVRDLKSIEALLSMTADDWKSLMGEIGNSNGSAAKMAETQLDNLAGDTTKFKSALGEAKIALVEGLTPTLRNYVKGATNLIQRLTNAFKKKGLSGAIKEASSWFKDFAGQLQQSKSGILRGIGNAIDWFSQLKNSKNIAEAAETIISGLKGAFKAVKIKVADILGIEDADNATWGDIAKKTVDRIKSKFTEFKIKIADMLGIEDAEDASWGTIAKNISDRIKAKFTEAKIKIADMLGIEDAEDASWGDIARKIVKNIKSKFTGAKIKIADILGIEDSKNATWGDIGKNIVGRIKIGIGKAKMKIADVLGIEDADNASWSDIGQNIIGRIKNGLSGIKLKAADLLGIENSEDATWADIGKKVMDGLTKYVSNKGGFIKQLILGDEYVAEGENKSTWLDVGKKISGWVTEAFSEGGILTALLGDLSDKAQAVAEFAGTLISGLATWISQNPNSLVDIMVEIAGAIGKAAGPIVEALTSIISNPSLWTALGDMLKAVIKGIFGEDVVKLLFGDENIQNATKAWNEMFDSGNAAKYIKDKFGDTKSAEKLLKLYKSIESKEFMGAPISQSEWEQFAAALAEAEAEATKATSAVDEVGKAAEAVAGDYDIHFNVTSDKFPSFTGGGGAGAPSKNGYVAYNAKGNWNVPYDNYPTLLHRGEMVLTKSQARQLRDGNGGGSSVGEMVSASVEKAMSKVYVMLNGNKVGDLTSKRVKNNINASTYNKLRAMGG